RRPAPPSGAAISGRGAPLRASTCSGPTRPTGGCSPACRPSSPRCSYPTSSGWAVAATAATDRPGSCSAPHSPPRRAASSGPISRAASWPWCPTRRSCRWTPCTASPPASWMTPTRWRRFSTRAGSRRWRDCTPIRRAAGSGASTPAWCAGCRFRPRVHRCGAPWPSRGDAANPMTPPSRPYTSSMPPIAVRWQPPRILSEHLGPLPEPLACLLTPGPIDAPAAVAALGARALLDLAPLGSEGRAPWPAWLAPHQVPAAERLRALLARYGGALLADAPGLGKSYVALAVAFAVRQPFALVVPAVLVDQWRALLARFDTNAPMITHESLSATPRRPLPPAAALCRLFLVDEAHRFRNPDTNRYRALARLVVGARVLLVTATPVHNRVGDLCHLLRLFLRDHELTALGVPSLRGAARGDADADPTAFAAAAARLCVSRSRERAQPGWSAGPGALSFPVRGNGAAVRLGAAPDTLLERLVAGIARLDSGGEAAALFRLLLLSQLASSIPALRASLARYRAWLELARAATAAGSALP